jgi:DNA (cytosine-5)-methyltransferase 1
LSKFTHASFFSGIDGFHTGLSRVGGSCIFANDIDKYVQRAQQILYGITPTGDITQLHWHDVPQSDIWTFGFPCVDISRARMDERKGLDGERSGLFYEVMRLLDETQHNAPKQLPRVLLAENVEELGDVLDVLRGEFEWRGYRMYAKLFNSKHWGVAQNRPRYYVVGVREDIDTPFTFPIEDTSNISELFDFLDMSVDVEEKYYYADDIVAQYYIHNPHAHKPGELNQIGTLDYPGWLDYMKRVYSIEGIAPTLHTCQGGHRQAKVYIYGRVRKLTPREYLRLQGFPDEYYTTLREHKMSDAQLYKMAGNAVSVPIVQAIGEQLVPLLHDTPSPSHVQL